MGSGLFIYKSGCSSTSYFVWRTVIYVGMNICNLNEIQVGFLNVVYMVWCIVDIFLTSYICLCDTQRSFDEVIET